MPLRRVLLRIATLVIGSTLLFEVMAAIFNIATATVVLDYKSFDTWLIMPLIPIMAVCGVMVLRGTLWPALVPLGYITALVAYSMLLGGGPIVLPWLTA